MRTPLAKDETIQTPIRVSVAVYRSPSNILKLSLKPMSSKDPICFEYWVNKKTALSPDNQMIYKGNSSLFKLSISFSS